MELFLGKKLLGPSADDRHQAMALLAYWLDKVRLGKIKAPSNVAKAITLAESGAITLADFFESFSGLEPLVIRENRTLKQSAIRRELRLVPRYAIISAAEAAIGLV